MWMKVPTSHAELSGSDDRDLSLNGSTAASSTGADGIRETLVEECGPKVSPQPMERWGDKARMWASLAALTLQTTGQVLLVKWARKASQEEGGTAYLNSTIVLFVELVKTAASLCLVVATSGGLLEAGASLREHFVEDPGELLKAAVPAVLYTIQTNLNLYSLEKLSAGVQQVLYQMKIITTAALGGLMLGKTLTTTKWISCFMLAAGIMLVQWPRNEGDARKAELDGGDERWEEQSPLHAFSQSLLSDKMLGFLAVLATSTSSGFNAVYIEKMLKNTTASIWIRNVQLGAFGSLVALVVVLSEDGAKVMEGGLTRGYTYRVWLVIFMSSFGGLLCAVMLKYAGATLGCFSTAMSIILTCTLSATLMKDFEPDALFAIGTALAISASLLWSLGPPSWAGQRAACC